MKILFWPVNSIYSKFKSILMISCSSLLLSMLWGCSYHSIYGNDDISGMYFHNVLNSNVTSQIVDDESLIPKNVSQILSSVWISQIDDSMGLKLRTLLNRQFHKKARSLNYLYILDVTLSDSVSKFSYDANGMPNRFKYDLSANYSLKDFNGNRVYFHSTSSVSNSFSSLSNLAGIVIANNKVSDRALILLSFHIRNDVASWIYSDLYERINEKPISNIVLKEDTIYSEGQKYKRLPRDPQNPVLYPLPKAEPIFEER